MAARTEKVTLSPSSSSAQLPKASLSTSSVTSASGATRRFSVDRMLQRRAQLAKGHFWRGHRRCGPTGNSRSSRSGRSRWRRPCGIGALHRPPDPGNGGRVDLRVRLGADGPQPQARSRFQLGAAPSPEGEEPMPAVTLYDGQDPARSASRSWAGRGRSEVQHRPMHGVGLPFVRTNHGSHSERRWCPMPMVFRSFSQLPR